MSTDRTITNRLLSTGLLNQKKAGSGTVLWLLAEHPVRLIDLKCGVSLGSELIIDDEAQAQWLMKITPVLVTCPSCEDMGLQQYKQQWWLWRYYDDAMEDHLLTCALRYHLNMIYFLEQSRSDTPQKNRYLGGKLLGSKL